MKSSKTYEGWPVHNKDINSKYDIIQYLIDRTAHFGILLNPFFYTYQTSYDSNSPRNTIKQSGC